MTLTTSDGATRTRDWADAAEAPADGRTGTLIDALWPAKVPSAFRATVLILAGTLLLAISAKIQVPFWPVPITLQTLAVMLIGAAYGPWLGAATVLAYLGEGALGFPVFAGAVPNPAYIFGTTGGFLLGMVAAAFIIGWDAKRWGRSIPRLAATMFVADLVLFVIGFGWLAWVVVLPSGTVGIGADSAWANGVVPFLLGDAVKIGIAACLIPAAWSLLKRRQ